jgi:hypothetical protein
MIDTFQLLKRLQTDVEPESALYESTDLKNLMEKNAKEMSVGELKKNISDLSGRLHYCSDTAEGRKVRKELESRITEMETELKGRDKNEGKVPNPKAPDAEKVKALREESPEMLPPDDVTPPKPQVQPEPMAPENKPEPTADQGQPEMTPLDKQLNDLVTNMTSAREHFDKGNLKVASELLKLVSDDLKTFKDAIKMKKEEAAPAPTEEKKVSEQEEKYAVIARGISDEEVAKKIAADRKGMVVKDDQDEHKFKVIMKERFSVEDVEAIVKEAKDELEAIKKEKANEAEARELKLKTLSENFEELVNALAEVSKKGKQELTETIATLDEKKKEIIEAIGNLAMLKDMQVKGLQADLLKNLLEKKKEEKEAR